MYSRKVAAFRMTVVISYFYKGVLKPLKTKNKVQNKKIKNQRRGVIFQEKRFSGLKSSIYQRNKLAIDNL